LLKQESTVPANNITCRLPKSTWFRWFCADVNAFRSPGFSSDFSWFSGRSARSRIGGLRFRDGVS